MTRSERGFSLIELMVAMTVTLIVSGAIYGLLASGGNAFRREPEVADRQQNIRLAMDLITRDVFNAGAAMPTFSQVFTLADPAGTCTAGFNGCGIAGTLGPAAATARGSDSELTDSIEMVAADERCATLTVCSTAPAAGAAGLFVTREGLPGCLGLPGLVLLVDGDTQFSVQPAAAGTGGGACPSGGSATVNGNLELTAPVQPWAPSAAFSTPGFVYPAEVVRYTIAPSGDPLDNSPALWRSGTGQYTSAGAAGGAPGSGAPWELVARGIEDMQFEYFYGATTAAATWHNQPPASAANQWNTLVREVRITLSARVTAANLQGETQPASGVGPNALRGQLSTTVAPRAAFNELQMGGQIQ
jgi:prepilin-type N-terminal cleavage/methylation domain-containing protein